MAASAESTDCSAATPCETVTGGFCPYVDGADAEDSVCADTASARRVHHQLSAQLAQAEVHVEAASCHHPDRKFFRVLGRAAASLPGHVARFHKARVVGDAGTDRASVRVLPAAAALSTLSPKCEGPAHGRRQL